MKENKLETLKAKACAAIDKRKDEFIELSIRIHDNPELAFHEFKAMEWVTDYLGRNGLEIHKGIGNLETAYRADLKGSTDSPRIALLAEYDALPGIGHGCGHNIMAVISPAAALALQEADPEHPGLISVFGTPAEENGGGKALLCKRGEFKGYDTALLVHPAVCYEVDYKSIGCQTFRVEFFGKAAHAAAAPERGINALDAMINSFNLINALRQHVKPDVRIHGIITNGGKASNIVPDYTAGEFTVRSTNDDYLDEVLQKVIRIFKASAEAVGCTVKFDFNEARYATMQTNQTLANAFAENMRSLGLPVQDRDPNRGMGSSDIGNISHEMPAVEGWFKIAGEEVEAHSPEFAAAAISPAGHQALLDAAKTIAMTTLDILYQPGLLQKIKEEFEKNVTPIQYHQTESR
jgi:amidohydrolase